MYYSLRDSRIMALLGFEDPNIKKRTLETNTNNNNKDMVLINKILQRDPTNLDLSQEEKDTIIKWRKDLKVLPHALIAFLSSVNWLDELHVKMVLEELPGWKLPKKLEEFVPLLDVRFHNEFVRTYAVRHLEKMTDKEM